MKKIANLSIVLSLLSFFLSGCKKEGVPAIVSTTVVSHIMPFSATVSAVVINDGGNEVSRGFCWGTKTAPDISGKITRDSTGIGDFTATLSDLTIGTTYYVRAYATGAAGTTYGEEVTFRTTPLPDFKANLNYGTVSDIDGNVYKIIQIGTQTWMAENLKTTRYRNGDAIPNVKNNADWISLTTGAYCSYDNNEDYSIVYGRIYNGHAVNDSRNIAPTGWHIPSSAEWSTLINYLGGTYDAAKKLSEAGTQHWLHNSPEQKNESGFTALPGGHREAQLNAGRFYNLGLVSNFWSTTQNAASMNYVIINVQQAVIRSLSPEFGMYVRCVKD